MALSSYQKPITFSNSNCHLLRIAKAWNVSHNDTQRVCLGADLQIVHRRLQICLKPLAVSPFLRQEFVSSLKCETSAASGMWEAEELCGV